MNNHNRTYHKQKIVWNRLAAGVLLLFLAIVFTGCYGGAVKEEIWLKGNERWEAEFTFTLTADEREALEAEMGEDGFKEFIESAASEDVSLKIDEREEPDGGISYIIKSSGRGLTSLNNECFDGSATVRKDDDDNIYISWSPNSDYTYMLREMTVVLHGREIISSNANTMDDGTATWHNPSYLEAKVAQGGFPFAKVLLVGMALVFLMGLVIFGGVGFFLLLRKQQSKEETA
jgi:hypothetical protein